MTSYPAGWTPCRRRACSPDPCRRGTRAESCNGPRDWKLENSLKENIIALKTGSKKLKVVENLIFWVFLHEILHTFRAGAVWWAGHPTMRLATRCVHRDRPLARHSPALGACVSGITGPGCRAPAQAPGPASGIGGPWVKICNKHQIIKMYFIP